MRVGRRRPASPQPNGTSCANCGNVTSAGSRFCVTCGTALPDAGEADIVRDLRYATLGEYDIVGKLGRGGMGIVYLGHEIALDRKVAIKVLLPSLVSGEAMVDRFRREARIAASLRHRHITSIFGLKQTDQLLFFVMDYVDGRTLQSVIDQHAPLSTDAVEAVFFDVASALTHAHGRGVMHRDIKPANIIVDKDGKGVVTDFGVAKASWTDTLTSHGLAIGSPRYMSPEQWSGKASMQSDQYALGVVLYEMLVGRAPFCGEGLQELMQQHLSQQPAPIREARADCPPNLEAAVLRMLAKEEGDRWGSLEEAAAAAGAHDSPMSSPVRQKLADYARDDKFATVVTPTPRSPIPSNPNVSSPGAQTMVASKRMVGLLSLAAVVLAALTLFSVYWFLVRSGGPSTDPIALDDSPGEAPARLDGENVASGTALDDSARAAAEARRLSDSVTNEQTLATVNPNGANLDEGAVAGGAVTPRNPVSQPRSRQAETRRDTTPTPVPRQAVQQTPPPVVTPEPEPEPEEPVDVGTGVVRVRLLTWSTVSVDGEDRGRQTRFFVDTLLAGATHTLRFSRDGYEDYEERVTVERDQTKQIEVRLQRKNNP